MTPSEAARIIGCAKSTVLDMIRSGRLKAKTRKFSGHYRVNQHGYVYDVPLEEAQRVRDEPQTKGFPRGKKRKRKTNGST